MSDAKMYSKEEAIKILYNAFLEKGDRLESNEILNNIKEKKLFSKNELKTAFGTGDMKLIWKEVDAFYGIDTFRTEKLKQELIKEMQDEYKIVQPFNNKTVKRIFRNKMERFFGSWVEAMIVSGLKPRSIIPHTLSNERKDLILENLMSITLSEGKIPTKTNLGDYKNIPNYKLFKEIYGIDWEELVLKLDLKKSKRKQFNKLSNSEVFHIFEGEINKNNCLLLSEYSLNISPMAFEFLYYMERFEISWEWMILLMKNGFTNIKDNKIAYTRETLINVLTFKYILNGDRHLKALELNNDQLLPNIDEIMGLFGKGMYEVWLLVEENAKTYY